MRGEPRKVVSVRSCRQLEFLVLGPLVMVGSTGEVLSLGPPRQRALLAALLINRGVALSVERLTSLLWGERPPLTAATMVHGAVAGVRRVIEPSGCGKASSLLVTRGGDTFSSCAATRLTRNDLSTCWPQVGDSLTQRLRGPCHCWRRRCPYGGDRPWPGSRNPSRGRRRPAGRSSGWSVLRRGWTPSLRWDITMRS